MKPVHNLPIKAFPCPGAIMQRQVEEGENSFVDFLRLGLFAIASQGFPRTSGMNENMSLVILLGPAGPAVIAISVFTGAQ